jgi:heterodisulfide reductase subunit A-like polyferredoxin
MTCVHLRRLYEICEISEIRLSSADLVHIVCKQCGHKEVCPSTILDEYEWNESKTDSPPPTSSPPAGREQP